jgi:hypothetical protein
MPRQDGLQEPWGNPVLTEIDLDVNDFNRGIVNIDMIYHFTHLEMQAWTGSRPMSQ